MGKTLVAREKRGVQCGHQQKPQESLRGGGKKVDELASKSSFSRVIIILLALFLSGLTMQQPPQRHS